MAKNTYRNEPLNGSRATNEFRGRSNEPRAAANTPRGQAAPKKKSGRSFKFSFPKIELPSFRINFLHDKRFKLFAGFFFLLLSFCMVIAFVSYIFTGHADQSVVESVSGTGLKESGQEAENWLGLFGAWISHLFIYKWLGLGAFFIIPVLFLTGARIVFRRVTISLSYVLGLCSFSMLWLSLTLGYVVYTVGAVEDFGFLGGGIGIETAIWMTSLIGWGSGLVLGFLFLVFLVFFFDITSINWGSSKAAADISGSMGADSRAASSIGD
ncbi:MAG TPA: DNA translocase FtsK 4TM domain-containing protein, partial [Pontibacter sp.]